MVGGFFIEKDTVVFFNQHSVCYEKEFWGDPKAFRPERMLSSDGKLNQTMGAHVMSFGLGRRRCVGEIFAKMEVFVVFATLMQRCEFLKPEGVAYDLEPIPGLVYSPKDYKVVVKER